MLTILALLLALSADAAITTRTVRTTGGDYPATLPGLQSAVDFCAALNDTDPCVIDVEAGVTISGAACTLFLPAQTNATKPIVIRSSRLSELPENVRVTAADASKMPKIESTCSGGVSYAVIQVLPSVPAPSHYILQGLDVQYSATNTSQPLIAIILIGGTLDAKWFHKAEMAPHNIVIDRCYIHGMDVATWVLASNTHAATNGVSANGRAITVRHSRIEDINRDNSDHNSAETKALAAFNSPGGNVHLNNLFDGTIGSLYGGANTWIPALVPSGLKFYGNEYTRAGSHWHWNESDTVNALDTTKPCITGSFWNETNSPFRKWKCVAGAWESTTETRPNRNSTKNGWEVKNARDVVAEGNYIHDIPATGDESQNGYAFLLNQVDGHDIGLTDHVRNEAVTIRYNRVVRVGEVVTVGGLVSNYPVINNRITFQHNIAERLQSFEVSPKKGAEFDRNGGKTFRVSLSSGDLIFEKNTVLSDRDFSYNQWAVAFDTPPLRNVRLRDNILSWGYIGHTQLNTTSDNCASFAVPLVGAIYWSHFALVDNQSRGATHYNSIYGNPACPSTNQRVATWGDVGFVNYLPVGGDYRLCTGAGTPAAGCTGASVLATDASDGGPLGADAQQVSRMTAGAVSGIYDAGLFAMGVRAWEGSNVRYTPYHPGGSCTINVKKGNTQLMNQDDGITGGLLQADRTLTINTDGAGDYTVRVTCRTPAGTEVGWREMQQVLR